MARTFTFKDHNPEGRWRSFDHMYIYIKFGGKVCGTIHEISSTEWKISFLTKRPPAEITKEKPCPWNRFTLKHRGTSKQETKEWLKARTESIMAQLDLYFEEE